MEAGFDKRARNIIDSSAGQTPESKMSYLKKSKAWDLHLPIKDSKATNTNLCHLLGIDTSKMESDGTPEGDYQATLAPFAELAGVDTAHKALVD